MNKYSQEHFETLAKGLREYNERVEKILIVNEKIKEFNWAFIHPYVFGSDISYLDELIKTKTITNEYVFKIFIWPFFSLKNTAYFIDGHCKMRPSIAPFCPLIDQSVFLCLQRDYAGAINILLPVIEGSIRHYLVHKKGKQNEKIMRTSGLISAFEHIKQDYMSLLDSAYSNDYDFNKEQKKEVLKLHRISFEAWLSIITDYFENNLYLDTRDGVVNDKLNRHAIIHGFNSEIYYNLENYLRIFNCLHFLCWAFAMADKSLEILSSLDEKEVYYKWKAFEKIKAISDLSFEAKASVYEKYPEFDKAKFIAKPIKEDAFEKYVRIKSKKGIENKLNFIDKYIEKKKTQ